MAELVVAALLSLGPLMWTAEGIVNVARGETHDQLREIVRKAEQ